jgi:DNA mismatch repair protein MutH
MAQSIIAIIAPTEPTSEAELMVRARALDGRRLGELADALGVSLDGAPVRTKGLAGQLVERALGATAGSAARPDFPSLGIELKTIPVDDRRAPRESTFVTTIDLATADRAEWETSVVRAKLARVLWIPIGGDGPLAARTIGRPVLWAPSPDEEKILRADFELLIGTIGAGGVESVSAHLGEALQVRPKAATSRVRTDAVDFEGEPISTVPRGFYLRAPFTARIIGT